MSGPYLVERSQAEQVARRHGMQLVSKRDTAAMYGRWAADGVVLSVTRGDHGWTAAVEGRLPNGDRSGLWRSGPRPQLALVEAQVIAAERCFTTEHARTAA